MMRIIQGERVAKAGQLRIGCTAIIFDTMRQKILLTRRQDNGRWCLPGGLMEVAESAGEACVREVEEETGLHVRLKKLIGVYSSPNVLIEYADGNRYHMVGLCFEAEPIGGELRLSDETTGFGYFTLAEIETMDLVEHQRERIQDAFLAQTAAFMK